VIYYAIWPKSAFDPVGVVHRKAVSIIFDLAVDRIRTEGGSKRSGADGCGTHLFPQGVVWLVVSSNFEYHPVD
jgi:hypothetical protein